MLKVCTLLLCTAPMAFAQSDAELSNQYYRYTNPALEAVCAGMSPTSHVSGLTDGAFLAVPFTGHTYYYQSACYLELARRTSDVAWCAKVRERKTLLGDGSSHTPASCARMVAAQLQRLAQDKESAAKFSATTIGVLKIRSAQATELPDGDWQLSVRTDGTLAGRYRMEIVNSRDRTRLVREDLTLPQTGQHSWRLVRNQVVGSSKLPNIFPIAVSLTYVFPAESAYAGQEHLSSIQNLTLSVPATP